MIALLPIENGRVSATVLGWAIVALVARVGPTLSLNYRKFIEHNHQKNISGEHQRFTAFTKYLNSLLALGNSRVFAFDLRVFRGLFLCVSMGKINRYYFSPAYRQAAPLYVELHISRLIMTYDLSHCSRISDLMLLFKYIMLLWRLKSIPQVYILFDDLNSVIKAF